MSPVKDTPFLSVMSPLTVSSRPCSVGVVASILPSKISALNAALKLTAVLPLPTYPDSKILVYFLKISPVDGGGVCNGTVPVAPPEALLSQISCFRVMLTASATAVIAKFAEAFTPSAL